mgnify:CR=1 FL=1
MIPIFHGIDITDESRYQGTRLLAVQFIGRKASKFFHQTAPECMRNFLAEYRQKTLSCRLQKTRQCKKSEIQQNSFHPEGMFICQKINQLCQHKRREQCENNRTADDSKKCG